MSQSNRNAFAASVSRVIRRDVMRPLPSETPITRQGVRVSRGPLEGECNVRVDIDAPGRAARIAAAITEALVAAGYEVTPNSHDALILNVARVTR